MSITNPVIYSIDDLRKAASDLGSHYFDRDTMRFFNSRVLEGIYRPSISESPRAGLFVTSERQDWPYEAPGQRLYSVRRFTITRTVREGTNYDIDVIEFGTVGEFQQYTTARAAKRAAQSIADDAGMWLVTFA